MEQWCASHIWEAVMKEHSKKVRADARVFGESLLDLLPNNELSRGAAARVESDFELGFYSLVAQANGHHHYGHPNLLNFETHFFLFYQY